MFNPCKPEGPKGLICGGGGGGDDDDDAWS